MANVWSLDRPTMYGGLAGLITAAIALAAKTFFGFDIPAEYMTFIPVVIGYLITWFVPPTVQDVIKNVDDKIIAIARASDMSPASEKEKPMTSEIKAAVAKETGKTV